MKSKDREIGKIVKGWIGSAGKSQSSVARELGISQQNFNHQLRGSRPLPTERINTLAEMLKPPVSDMLEIKRLIASKATEGLKITKLYRVRKNKIKDLIELHPQDHLLNELKSQWPGLNRGQKLKVLTFIEELLD